MLAPLLALLPSFELGYWLGMLGLRHRAREKTRALLLYGKPQATSIPVIDGRIRKWAGEPTKNQERVSRVAVRGIRAFINTKAFEHLITGGIRRIWPGHGQLDTEVRIVV
jgi:hypothetical protein